MSEDLKFKIIGDPAQAKKAFNEVRAAADDMAVGVAAGAAAAAGALVLVESAVISVSSEFENYKTQLETIEGSSAKAQQSMDWITEFAKETPYAMAGITDSFVTLKAYGIDPVDGTLRTLGDTAAAMGKPLKQGVEALADAMTGEFERLKEFGIKASVVGDQVSFAYTQNGQQMTATADKNSQQMIQATLMGIWNDKYQGGMDKMSQTWSGMTSNLGDNWTMFQKQIGDEGAFLAAKNVLGLVLEEINKNDEGMKDFAGTISNVLIDSMQVGVTGAALFGKGFAALQMPIDAVRVGIDMAALGGVKAFDVMLSAYESYMEVVQHIPGAIGDDAKADLRDVQAFRKEIALLEAGISQTTDESLTTFLDNSVEIEKKWQGIDDAAQKVFVALEAGRNAPDAASPDGSTKNKKKTGGSGSSVDPQIITDAQKVVDIHGAKFAKIQALAGQFDLSEQDRLLATNDFALTQLDAEQMRMQDALVAQGADKQQLADLENYYFDLKLQRGQETSDSITAIEQAEDEARLQRLMDGQQAAYDIKGQFNQLFNDQQQVHLGALVDNMTTYAKAAQGIDEMSGKQKLQFASTTFGMLSGLMASENEKQFKIGQKAARVENAINTGLAMTKAYQSMIGVPLVGPVLAAGAMAVAFKVGQANDQKIKSAQMGGGTNAGSVPTASAGGGGASPTTDVNPSTGLPAAPASTQPPAPTAPNQYTFHLGAGVDEAMVRDTIVPIIRDLDENGEVTILSEYGVTAQRIRDAA